jgi:cell division protein FtsI (penicillin-binding protein 3)
MLSYSALIGRITYLHYTQYKFSEKRTEKVMAGSKRLFAERAPILDAKGRVLAVSVKNYGCAVDPTVIKELPVVLSALAGVLNLSDKEAERIKIRAEKKGCRFVWIKRSVTTAEIKSIRNLKLPGISFVSGWSRQYPQGETACHLIGFTNVDNYGIEGLEGRWNTLLKSENGSQLVKRDARRRIFMLDKKSLAIPRKGLKVKTTIDLYIQHVVEKELQKISRQYKTVKSIAIAMDPQTGEVLAMANNPAYNLNNAYDSEDALRLNSAVASIYEPGSIFKPFVLSAVLDQNAVSLKTGIFCENGEWRLRYRTLHDAHGYGYLSAEKVVVKSSNIGIAKIAAKIGKVKLYKYLFDFGFGRKTGSRLTGELSGVLRHHKLWSDHFSMTSIPMGQEVSATSLQLAAGFCSIVNGGLFLRPKLIKALIDQNNDDTVFVEADPLRRVISENTSMQMRSVLGKVVKEGTGRRARSRLYEIGGKTGTAQIAGLGGYQEDKYVASFIGFAPVENPKILVLVSAFEPKGQYYGGIVSAPAAKEIIEKSLLYLKEPPVVHKKYAMR